MNWLLLRHFRASEKTERKRLVPANPENQRSQTVTDIGGGIISAINATAKANCNPDAKVRVRRISLGHMRRDLGQKIRIVIEIVRPNRRGSQLPLSHGFETLKLIVSGLVKGFPIRNICAVSWDSPSFSVLGFIFTAHVLSTECLVIRVWSSSSILIVVPDFVH